LTLAKHDRSVLETKRLSNHVMSSLSRKSG